MKIAFLGLGNMGIPMVTNLMGAGHDLVLYNRTAEKADAFIERGAGFAGTPREAAAGCDIAVTMLANDEAVEQVVFGDDGLMAGLAEDAVHISSSTISIDLVRKLASEHEKRNQRFVSATVIGRPDAAKAAKLRILLAGCEAARKQVIPVLNSLGEEIFEIGDDPEKSNVVKLCNNFLLVSMLDSIAETQALVEKYGISPAVFMDIINSFFQSPVYRNYGNIMIERRFDPAGFKLKLGLKDVRLALAAAQNVGAQLPLGETIREHFELGLSNGNGELDWASLLLNYIDTDG